MPQPFFEPDALDRETDPARLDWLYNNRARVPAHPAFLARWAQASATVRAARAEASIDVAYGEDGSQRLDVFPAEGALPAAGAPVLFFIHGGYWRALDKGDHSFVAPAFTRAGVCVVVPNYALCPGSPAQPVGVDTIALQMVRALAWTWRHVAAHGGDPSRIVLAGHSAGGHLASMLLHCRWDEVADDLPPQLAHRALSLSGLYDLRPLARAPFLASALRLDDARARVLSPLLWPAPRRAQLWSVVGGAETEGFLAQNAAIRAAWGERAVPMCETLPGLHHFSIVDALADPAHALHRLALRCLGR